MGGTRWKRGRSESSSSYLSTEQLQDYILNIRKTSSLLSTECPDSLCPSMEPSSDGGIQKDEGSLPVHWMNAAADYFFGSQQNSCDDTLPSSTTWSPQREGELSPPTLSNTYDIQRTNKICEDPNFSCEESEISAATSKISIENDEWSTDFLSIASDLSTPREHTSEEEHIDNGIDLNFRRRSDQSSVTSFTQSIKMRMASIFPTLESTSKEEDIDDTIDLNLQHRSDQSSVTSFTQSMKMRMPPIFPPTLESTSEEKESDDAMDLRLLHQSYRPSDFQKKTQNLSQDPLGLESSAAASKASESVSRLTTPLMSMNSQRGMSNTPRSTLTIKEKFDSFKADFTTPKHASKTRKKQMAMATPKQVESTTRTPRNVETNHYPDLREEPETPSDEAPWIAFSALTETPLHQINEEPIGEEVEFRHSSQLLNPKLEKVITTEKKERTIMIMGFLLFLLLLFLGILFAIEPWKTVTANARAPQGSPSSPICEDHTNIVDNCICRLELPTVLPSQVSVQRQSMLEYLLSNNLVSDDIAQEFLANERSCSTYNQALLFASDLSFTDSIEIDDLQITLLQRYVLALVYQNLQGRQWLQGQDTWVQASQSECKWKGVVCSSTSGQILKLLLGSNQLQGHFPSELALLPSLKHLDLSHNPSLFGTFPLKWTTSSKWQFLDLSSTGLYGTIPKRLSRMQGLYELKISDTRWEGTIPMQLGFMTQLRSLDLSHNSLSGTIPDGSWRTLRRLHTLDLSDNSLTGSLPTSWNMPNLESLKLNHNELTEWIPDPPYGSFLQNLELQPISAKVVPSSYCTNLPLLDTLRVVCENSEEEKQCRCCTCWRG